MRVLDIEQRTPEWFAARNAVITGTRLKAVLGTGSNALLYELIAEQLAPAPELVANDAMERGAALEEDALAVYEATTGQDVATVGFVLHDEFDWLGVSPDALVKKGRTYSGAVEVKCPDTKTHIKYLTEGKVPTEYRAQVLQYFLVCDTINWLDFVSYDPRINLPELQLFTVRITRAELHDELEVAWGKLYSFRAKWEELTSKYIF